MEEIQLRTPTAAYAEDVMQFRQELLAAEESFAGCSFLESCATAEEWLKILDLRKSEATCPEGCVPSSSYLAVRLSDNKIVGITDLRHHINHPVLGLWAGHIGYTVRPDERRKGYGKEILRQHLQNCRDLGLEKVLISCSTDKLASEKIILTNGGVFEKEVEVEGVVHKKYWIQL